MAHNHSHEYQIRTIYGDGTEELSGWLIGEEQLNRAMGSILRAHGKSFWLRARNVLCPDCRETEERIVVECPIANHPSSQYRPRNVHQAMSAGGRPRYEVA